METTYSIKNFAMRIVTAVVLLCVLSVGNAWGTDYELITSTSDLEADANYVIGSAASGNAYFMSTATSTNNRQQTSDITITDGVITATSEVLVLQLGGTTGAWTFLTTNYTETNGYLTSAASGKNNHCKVVSPAEDCSYFTIAFSDDAAVITSTGRNERNILRYNSSSSPAIFACYSSGQNPVYLFKEVQGGSTTYTVTYNANTGSGTMTDSNSPYDEDATVTVLSNTFTAPDGYVFDHWNTAADDSGTDYAPGATFTITANTTLYAQWVSAPGVNYVLTDITDLTSEDVFIIVGNNGSDYALPNNGGASTPTVVGVTVTNDVINTAKTTILWNISGNASDGYTFYPNGTTETWLYLLEDNNNGVRIGIGAAKVFTINNGYLYTTQTTSPRYVGIYNSEDWRCYTSTTGNIAGQTFAFYKREPELTFYRTKCYREFTDAEADGKWSTEGNWTNSRLPNINDLARINKPVTVDMEVPTAAKAKNVVIYNDGSTHTGQLIIDAGKELVVAGTVRKTTNGSNYTATGENDIVINSTSGAGLGALVMGTHDGTNNATVNFYTKSNGERDNNNSDAQYVGTPFGNEPAMLYQFYNSWMFEFTNNHPKTSKPGWIRLDGDDKLKAFQGYCVYSADAWDNDEGHNYWMQGTLVASKDTSITLAYKTGTASNPDNENMLANSWMAPIKIKAFDEDDFTNADATIYIYNTGSPTDYGKVSGYGSAAGQYSCYTVNECDDEDIIPSMQAFSVYTKGNDPKPKITLDYSKLVYNPAEKDEVAPGPNKAPKRGATETGDLEKMRLRILAESGYGDMVYMHEREDFAEGFENGWDGRKMFGEDVAPQLYAVTPDGNMAINCIPTFEGQVLGFRKGTQDNVYTFTFEYEGENTWYLNDLKEQTSTLISSESRYMFMASDEDMAARFIISQTPIHSTPTGTEQSAISDQQSAVKKIVIDDKVFIIRNGQMYHVTGVMVR